MKKMNLLLIGWIGIAVGTASCASTSYRITDGSNRPAFEKSVLVYQQTPPSEVKYQVIGEFVEQKQWYGGTGETKREALHAAAEKGANGILIEKTGQRVTGW